MLKTSSHCAKWSKYIEICLKQSPNKVTTMKISVLMAVFNEEKFLDKTLSSSHEAIA